MPKDIFHSSFFMFFAKKTRETLWLYLGRGKDYQGLWITKTAPPAALRVQDTLLSLCRKYLISPWQKVEFDSKDRIVALKTTYFGQSQYFIYFWHGVESYFVHHYFNHDDHQWVSNKSWDYHQKFLSPVELDLNTLQDFFNEVGRKNLPDKSISDIESVKSSMNYQLERYFKTALNTSSQEQRLLVNKHQRKIDNIKKDLENLSNFNALKAYLDQYPVEIPDSLKFGKLQIKFPSLLNVEQRRNLAFEKYKNWKKNYSFMLERLNQEESKPAPTVKVNLEIPIRPVWNLGKNKKAPPPTTSGNKPDATDCSFFDYPEHYFSAALGKSATSNDYLRSQWANKNDYWFHLADMPSAHLFIRVMPGFCFSPIIFSLLGTLLLNASKSSANSANLLYCLVKDLRSVKGKPGTVLYKNEKRIHFIKSSAV